VGAGAGLLPVVPWYAATAGISADGFNYEPGLGYAALSIARNFEGLLANVGLFGLLLALFGAACAWHRRKEAVSIWNAVAACLSLILATLALQAIVPVDLDPRYMAPALPAVLVLAVSGAIALARLAAGAPRLAAAPLRVPVCLPAIAAGPPRPCFCSFFQAPPTFPPAKQKPTCGCRKPHASPVQAGRTKPG
jgi:hypothetical protein